MSRPARRRTRARSPARLSAPTPVGTAPSTGRPDVERVNALNVGLVLLAAVVAWVSPFQLLLVSYAVLGPLHYLTQISWLHDRSYFATGRWGVLLLVVLAVAASVERSTHVIGWNGWAALAFGLSIALAFVRGRIAMPALAAASVVAAFLVQRWHGGWLVLVVLLPTVIHVSVFTALFMLEGNLRTRSAWGHVALAVYGVCGVALLAYRPAAGHHVIGARATTLFEEFVPVVNVLGVVSGAPAPLSWDGFVAVGRFLGFAYTYHYLNWFSKTGIIRWHAMSGRRTAAIAVVYAVSVGVYAWDYAAGIAALFLLSLLHVLLELPLDLRTMAALGGRAVAVLTAERAAQNDPLAAPSLPRRP